MDCRNAHVLVHRERSAQIKILEVTGHKACAFGGNDTVNEDLDGW
jgi:hypothetical protein